jgi:hypothetical protein
MSMVIKSSSEPKTKPNKIAIISYLFWSVIVAEYPSQFSLPVDQQR